MNDDMTLSVPPQPAPWFRIHTTVEIAAASAPLEMIRPSCTGRLQDRSSPEAPGQRRIIFPTLHNNDKCNLHSSTGITDTAPRENVTIQQCEVDKGPKELAPSPLLPIPSPRHKNSGYSGKRLPACINFPTAFQPLLARQSPRPCDVVKKESLAAFCLSSPPVIKRSMLFPASEGAMTDKLATPEVQKKTEEEDGSAHSDGAGEEIFSLLRGTTRDEKPESERDATLKQALTQSRSPMRSILPRFRPLSLAPFIQINDPIMEQDQPQTASTSSPLPSILRRRTTLPTAQPDDRQSEQESDAESISKISSVESDIPSLASSLHSSSDAGGCPLSQIARRRCNSEPAQGIRFSPRVWVREFQRTEAEVEATWFTCGEMEAFKTAAMQRIIALENQTRAELIPTGTGRMVHRVVVAQSPVSKTKALFSHRALRMDADSPDKPRKRKTTHPSGSKKNPHGCGTSVESKKKIFRCAVAENEIREILLVDPRDVCLDLFAKGLGKVLPHAKVTTATNFEDALSRVRHKTSDSKGKRGFDVVIVEERLNPLAELQDKNDGSGSALLSKLGEQTSRGATKILFIGVSSRLRQDAGRLQESGADLLWSKPPPRMDQQLRDSILKALLLKRGRSAVAETLFD